MTAPVTVNEGTSPPYDALPYTGVAPFGTCEDMALANALEAAGLVGADARLGATWHAAFDGGRLRGHPHRLDILASLHAVRIDQLRADGADPVRHDAAVLATGARVMAVVDSFEFDCPHRGLLHLPHAVLLVAVDGDAVCLRDPMYRQDPHWVSGATYRAMRTPRFTSNGRILAIGPVAAGGASPLAVLASALADFTGTAVPDALDLFAQSLIESNPADIDVATCAGERVALAKTVASLARDHGGRWVQASGEVESLVKRWYLLHSLALQAGPSSATRIAAAVSALGEREQRAHTLLSELSRAAGHDHA